MTFERDRETVVTTSRRDGPGLGLILGIVILLLLILAAVWYFGLGGGNPTGTAPAGGESVPAESQPAESEPAETTMESPAAT